MSEESFIVRVYRQGRRPGPEGRAHDQATLTGVVEIVDRGERRSFHDIEELWTILAGTGGKGEKRTRES